MTLAGKRAEIAGALSNAPGCRGWAKRPVAPNVGDCWPTLGGLVRADEGGDAFYVTWAVRVFPPQNEVAAEDWWDAHWSDLYYALKPVGYVTAADPILLPAQQGGDQLAYQITLRAEE